MKERESHEPDQYWQQDLAIGEGRFHHEPYTIRLKVHTTEERRDVRNEIVPLGHKPGQRIPRTYLHAKPYILVPEITLTMALYPKAEPSGAIGKVTASEWEGMRHEEVGNAQAWFYPEEYHPTLILWECFLGERYRQENPCQDESLTALWAGFERLLLEQCPGVERIATPSWEDIYPGAIWQEFLRCRGYVPFNRLAFGKEVE